MKNGYIYNTDIGRLYIADNGEAITDVRYCDGEVTAETPLIREAMTQITQYLKGERITFDLPLHIIGTDFQKQVWDALLTIPYGETRTYRDIAEMIGKPKACRAVGNANNHNPISIIIPCHRVIGADGSLTGYAGGLDIKQRLLEIERQIPR